MTRFFRTEETILDSLAGKECHHGTRAELQKLLRERQLEDREIKVSERHPTPAERVYPDAIGELTQKRVPLVDFDLTVYIPTLSSSSRTPVNLYQRFVTNRSSLRTL